jgi:hypothetical protein
MVLLIGEEPEESARRERLSLSSYKIGAATGRDEIDFQFIVAMGNGHAKSDAIAAREAPGDP